MDPIAYTYEAAHHCPACTEARFGRAADGYIAGQDEDGNYPEDGEGNPVGAIAPWEEWQSFTGEQEILACDDCGAVLDTYEPEEG